MGDTRKDAGRFSWSPDAQLHGAVVILTLTAITIAEQRMQTTQISDYQIKV